MHTLGKETDVSYIYKFVNYYKLFPMNGYKHRNVESSDQSQTKPMTRLTPGITSDTGAAARP